MDALEEPPFVSGFRNMDVNVHIAEEGKMGTHPVRPK